MVSLFLFKYVCLFDTVLKLSSPIPFKCSRMYFQQNIFLNEVCETFGCAESLDNYINDSVRHYHVVIFHVDGRKYWPNFCVSFPPSPWCLLIDLNCCVLRE